MSGSTPGQTLARVAMSLLRVELERLEVADLPEHLTLTELDLELRENARAVPGVGPVLGMHEEFLRVVALTSQGFRLRMVAVWASSQWLVVELETSVPLPSGGAGR